MILVLIQLQIGILDHLYTFLNIARWGRYLKNKSMDLDQTLLVGARGKAHIVQQI